MLSTDTCRYQLPLPSHRVPAHRSIGWKVRSLWRTVWLLYHISTEHIGIYGRRMGDRTGQQPKGGSTLTCQIFSSLELSFLCYDASWGASRTLHHHLLTNYAPPLRLRHFPTDLRLETDISRGYFLFQFWTQWTFLLTIYAAMFPFWLLYCIAYIFTRRKFVFATPGGYRRAENGVQGENVRVKKRPTSHKEVT